MGQYIDSFFINIFNRQFQMIMNSNCNKQKNYNRDYLKKKKSSEAFYLKAKISSHIGQQLKYLNPRKSQARISTSLIEINPKEDMKCIGSIQRGHEAGTISNIGHSKSKLTKQKKDIGECWSQRNMNLMNDSVKMHKYRKFSSNAQLIQPQPFLQSHRRKLSLVDQPQPTRKIEKLNLMIWLMIIRKLFLEQFKKRSSKTVKLNTLYSYIQKKLDKQRIQQCSAGVEPLEYEVQLSKSQIISIFESFFKDSKRQKAGKSQTIGMATFCQIIACLIQFQTKNNNITKLANHKSTSSQQEAVETARFQQGNHDDAKKRKISQKKHHLNFMPKIQTHKYIKQNGKQNIVASVNVNGQQLFKSPSTNNKSKQSLNPSHSPFTVNQPKSIENSLLLLERDESGPLIFKKGSFQIGNYDESLGKLTIEGKSPRQLMVSEIYESIQRQGFIHQNNVSFSLQHLQVDNHHHSFENTVHSFQQILKKIQNIQKSYKSKLDSQLIQEMKNERNEEVNLFLEQLINYRIAVSSQCFEEENYSYLVAFQNLSHFKEHNKAIMHAILQSTYLKQYFNALEGIKIKNSLPFLRSASHLFHQGLRILNISHNNISNISFILDSLTFQNKLQFLNINQNFFSDVSPILKKCWRLKELHCQSNLITEVREAKGAKQLKIIDLSYNKLQQQADLRGLIGLSSLTIINIFGNGLAKKNWKSEWKDSININLIYQMDKLYVMSSFGHQKDITFSLEKSEPKNQRDRYKNSLFIHEFSISQANRTAGQDELKFSKSGKLEHQLGNSGHCGKSTEPKQKICKIKTFYDGKMM